MHPSKNPNLEPVSNMPTDPTLKYPLGEYLEPEQERQARADLDEALTTVGADPQWAADVYEDADGTYLCAVIVRPGLAPDRLVARARTWDDILPRTPMSLLGAALFDIAKAGSREAARLCGTP